MPGDRRLHDGVGLRLLRARRSARRRRDACRAAAISSRRAPARSLADGFGRGAGALLAAVTRAAATSRRVAASSRCLREPALVASSASNRARSAVAACSSDSAALDVRLRRLGLRARLPDVFRPGAGLKQPQLRDGLSALGVGPAEREIGVGGVEPRDDVAGCDAIALRRPAVRGPGRRPPARRAPRSPRRSRTRGAALRPRRRGSAAQPRR